MGLKPTISAGEWPQTHDVDRVATGTGPDRTGHQMLLVCQNQGGCDGRNVCLHGGEGNLH
jgi:hypothetical protein